MYRVYVQPLTEKTKSKPLDDELVVNTENTNISVMNKDRLVSSIKDIKCEIFLAIKILNIVKNNLEIIISQRNSVESDINEADNRLNSFLPIMDRLENLMEEILSKLKETEDLNQENYNRLLEFDKLLNYIIPEFLYWLPDIELFKRQIEELGYYISIISEYSNNSILKYLKETLTPVYEKNTDGSIKISNGKPVYKKNTDGTIKFEGTLLTELKKVTELVDSKANQSDYDKFVKELEEKYVALETDNNYKTFINEKLSYFNFS